MDIEIFTDKPMPISQALEYLTDDFIVDGLACEQTTLDLRDACKVLTGKLEAVQKLCESEIAFAKDMETHRPEECKRWAQAFSMVMDKIA